MAYEKQYFRNGEILMAEQLNHIEDGIVKLEQEGGGSGEVGEHNHEIEDVTGLQSALDGKAESENAEFSGYLKQGIYVRKYLGELSPGTFYASLDDVYKDGTYHRMWRLRFPVGKAFSGRIRVIIYGSYNSMNAQSLMSKTINLHFNATGTLFTNVGYYDSLGTRAERDFRISEAIYNSEAGAFEILIWQTNLNGNNRPRVLLEFWSGSDMSAIDGITVQPVELTNATTYTAKLATGDLKDKTVTWADTPVFETPYGEAVEVKGHTHDIANVDGLRGELDNVDSKAVSAMQALGYTVNHIKYPYNGTHTERGVVWVDNGDGSITASGTATAQTSYTVYNRVNDNFVLPPGTYRLTGCPEGGSTSTYRIRILRTASTNGSAQLLCQDLGEGVEFTVTESTGAVGVMIYVDGNMTVENLTFKPMIVEVGVKTVNERLTKIENSGSGGTLPQNLLQVVSFDAATGTLVTRTIS